MAQAWLMVIAIELIDHIIKVDSTVYGEPKTHIKKLSKVQYLP